MRSTSKNDPSGTSAPKQANPLVKPLLMLGGVLSCGLGVVGVFIPVLPTTPLLLLSAFLFARSSERMAAWLGSTKVYKSYVLPFKKNEGVTRGTKIRMLGISYVVMGLSAFFVRNASVAPLVWAILLLVAAFLLWLVVWRLPTVKTEPATHMR